MPRRDPASATKWPAGSASWDFIMMRVSSRMIQQKEHATVPGGRHIAHPHPSKRGDTSPSFQTLDSSITAAPSSASKAAGARPTNGAGKRHFPSHLLVEHAPRMLLRPLGRGSLPPLPHAFHVGEDKGSRPCGATLRHHIPRHSAAAGAPTDAAAVDTHSLTPAWRPRRRQRQRRRRRGRWRQTGERP